MSFVYLRRRWIVAVLLGGTSLLVGIHGCLNPAFLNQYSGGSVVPLAPGDARFVHVLVVNSTADATLDVQFGWTPEFQGFITTFLHGIGPGTQLGMLLDCTVEQIGLGNPLNLAVPAITITRGELTFDVPASAFPLVFTKGSTKDFECGDTLVLNVIDDPTNGYGIKVVPGRVDGTTQTGPFGGPDTFQNLQTLLTLNGVTIPE